MTTRLAHVVVDANDPSALARFWAEVLGWPVAIDDPHEVEIGPGAPGDVPLIFVPVDEPKDAKSRFHFDLRTPLDEEQGVTVQRLIDLGARRADIGQGDVPWTVLADPEGNEFCVLPADYYDVETGAVAAICINAADGASLSGFWEAATGWPRARRGLHRGKGPFVVFGGGAPAAKVGKNRIHLDVAPSMGDDHEAEIARLVELGARRVDIGQGDVPWVVLADPEGNEFCVLTPRVENR